MDHTVGVLALQGDVHANTFAVLCSSMGSESAIAVRRPAELAAVDGLIIPGGESTTMIKLAKIFELYEPLRTAHPRWPARASGPARG